MKRKIIKILLTLLLLILAIGFGYLAYMGFSYCAGITQPLTELSVGTLWSMRFIEGASILSVVASLTCMFGIFYVI